MIFRAYEVVAEELAGVATACALRATLVPLPYEAAAAKESTAPGLPTSLRAPRALLEALSLTSPGKTYAAMVRPRYAPAGQRWQAAGSAEDALDARNALYSARAAVVFATTVDALVELLP